ncbi:MAG: hypothetical protein SCAL_001556 [Candidatus Syntrophoarchaeum caldarius]|uniref:DUF3160 domain-containing protein n=1 Tax=Candidatus Syntropharchaeum caldarium TaxID=1838285 RepID=A0A1F2P7F7_9EURY|nr:MAG: hypothetical protein SCAL_001556 [Candidatus Syntrophoarchaeum caldarius]
MVSGAKKTFSNHYTLNTLEFSPNSPQYTLPLETEDIENFRSLSDKIELSDAMRDELEQNGFVIIENPLNPQEEDITAPYKELRSMDIPVFITSDTLLHLYHLQFDESLKEIEEREFYGLICEITEELLEKSTKTYANTEGDLKEAARRNVAFFAVGLCLLEGENRTHAIPEYVADEVEAELKLIEAHSGFAPSPIFTYEEDYSQYVPRGHYTQSEELKRYFKVMSFYGRMSFLLKGGCGDCLVTKEDAELQTIGASLIAGYLAGSPDLMAKWERIYTVTAFFVGLSDDLGPYEYIDALNHVFGDELEPGELTGENINLMKAKLAEYDSPKIYGGTGRCEIDPPFTPEEADRCLENTEGFRLMGQRFIPDSYIFQNLVFPKVEGRLFPTGLDLMALLGSREAEKRLDELNESDYPGYAKQYAKLKAEFDAFDESDWNRNLYWAWLYTLKPLLKSYDDGYPTFMQTDAWQQKELNTSLASWTELRHDTILYAKQSYTMKATGILPPEVTGYVEPVPEFYNRLLALTTMTEEGLDDMGVLDDAGRRRLQNLEEVLKRLIEISVRELEGESLTEADYQFINEIDAQFDGVLGDLDEKAKKTTVIADVHTDTNTGKVLEEGVGYVNLILVAYKTPDNRILIAAGPVMSHYEFKQSMDERLTDEAWREMLARGFQA